MDNNTPVKEKPRKEKATILSGNLWLAIIKFSLPIILSLLLQTLYGTVDLFMVSKFATYADINAVSVGSQTVCIIVGITAGLATGLSVIIGQGIGEKNLEKVSKAIGNSLWIFGTLAILATIILMSASKGIAIALNAPEESINQTIHYILICGGGLIFVVAYNVLNAIFVGLGDSKTPLIFVSVAAVLNILCDYLLIAVANLGTIGAAIATIFSQMMSVIFCLIFIKKRLPCRLKKSDFKFSKELVKNIIFVGAPIGVLRMFEEISYLIILGVTNTFTLDAADGVAIAEKIVVFILLIPMAFMSSISTFVAQNIGAKQNDRAKKSFKISMLYSALIGGVMAVILFFFGGQITSLFNDKEEIINSAQEFLHATSIECFILSFSYCFLGYFDGRKKTLFVLIQGLVTILLVKIPFAYLANAYFKSLFNVGLSTLVAAGCSLLACIIYYIILMHKDKKLKIDKPDLIENKSTN